MKHLKQLLNPYKGLPKEVYVIFIARIINALGCFVMPLMTIILKDSIGLSDQLAGVYISAVGLLFLPASMLGGKLADTIGRKKVIVFFDCMAALFYIICSFMAPSMKMIYMIMAAAACLVTAGPAHDSLMADITTPKNRESAYALSYMGWNLGFAIGPFIGGMLYENHLPLIFLGDAFTALLSLSLVILFIKETIHKAEEEITDESRALERREEGSIFAVLAKRPVLVYFALIIFGFNFVYSQWSFLIPLHMLEKFPAHKAEYYGSLASFNGLIVILFTPLVTYYFQKSKSIRRMVYGGGLYAIGFGMLGLFNGLAHFFVSAFIFTLGEILLAISTAPFIANHTPASHRGRMSAVIPMIFGMGQTLGPIGMGQILNYASIELAWLLMGCVGIVFTILMFILEQQEEKKCFRAIEKQGC
ncbi:MFS family permease [Anaerosolibacter carboniphilus]|uniref:MFS family permease n=1 Tax=Anaerosolibacter carboniphilus TaxID=1417629 RepID=A0A841KPL5_9FIRM|nr:MFS transporter [Anaerosolibacter carboniphilus]MBB6214040.1 MFS family permease [Anaerosolibacter carboniphilus]